MLRRPRPRWRSPARPWPCRPGRAGAGRLDPPSPAESTLAAPFAGHLPSARGCAPSTASCSSSDSRRAPSGSSAASRASRAPASPRARRAPRAARRIPCRDCATSSPAAPRAARAPRGRARVGRRRRGASPQLEAIAACESGGDPGAVGGGGAYRGKYQFDLQHWSSVGGSGDPAAASEAEQDARAAPAVRAGGARLADCAG